MILVIFTSIYVSQIPKHCRSMALNLGNKHSQIKGAWHRERKLRH